MWLLDTTSITLHYFIGKNVPPYAILSHTWGNEEVSFQDIQNPPVNNPSSLGYLKIKACCEVAKLNGFKYVWVDTCCIDKTNSAELSEAINSMFAWYQKATECYAYLSDVESLPDLEGSKWFTRGWTLQELLAPRTVVFFNRDWNELGTKASLKQTISDTTNIPPVAILNNRLGEFSIAQRMSWAAHRETTREEDIAYSLLGIFGVNMPMIYGEGLRAFRRLQLEIMRISDDHSILAWTASKGDGNIRGPLALSPSEFANCSNIERSRTRAKHEYVMTNIGLRMRLPLAAAGYNPINPRFHRCIAFLDCQTEEGIEIGIHLEIESRINLENTSDSIPIRVSRTRTFELETSKTSSGLKPMELYIEEPRELRDTLTVGPTPQYSYKFEATCSSVIKNGFSIFRSEATFRAAWLADDPRFQFGRHCELNLIGSGTAGGLMFRHFKGDESFVAILGIYAGQVWSDIETHIGDGESLKDILASYNEPENTSNVLKRRASSRLGYLDRVIKPLSGGRFAKIKIRNKPPFSTDYAYHVEITIF